MCSIRQQPIHSWKLLFLFLAGAIKHRQQFICFEGGFTLNDKRLFWTVSSTAATHIKALLFPHQEKEGKCCCEWKCWFSLGFFPPGLHNVCRMKWNQGCYQAREVFLEIHSFMYVLQALSIMLFVRKGHSMASVLFPFSLSWPEYQAHCSVGSPFNSHHNSIPFLVVMVVVSARSFFPQESFCQRY